MPDYLNTARALRRKAADPVVPEPERRALLEKAAELERKYGNGNSQSTDDTTVTSRSGQVYDTGSGRWYAADEFWVNLLRYQTSYMQADRLREQQAAWNPVEHDDVEHDHWQEDEDEDAGYDIY